MPQPKDDLSRSLVALDQHRTLIAVVELRLATWLVGGMVPGIERDPLKKLVPDEEGLLKLLHRWCDEVVKALLGWLRGEKKHCSMAAAIPTRRRKMRNVRTASASNWSASVPASSTA